MACADPNPNIRVSAFDHFGIMGSGFAPTYERTSSMYNDFSSINTCSGVKSQASYVDVGTYQLSR